MFTYQPQGQAYNRPQMPINNYMNANYPPQPPSPQIHTVMVSSVDEVRSYIIDPFSTNYYLFPDLSGGKIYLRRMNAGKSEMYVFNLEQPQTQNNPDPMQKVEQRLANIENMLMGGIANARTNVPTGVREANSSTGTTPNANQPANVAEFYAKPSTNDPATLTTTTSE